MQTCLTLSIGSLPPMSARGCIQELWPVAQGEFRRTINGELVFVGNMEHKYASTIRCSDISHISTGNLQVGTEVLVGCIQTLCQKIDHDEREVTLERDFVVGSVQVFDEKGDVFDNFEISGKRTVKINWDCLQNRPVKPPLESNESDDLVAGNEQCNLTEYSDAACPLFISYNPLLRMRVISFKLVTEEWEMRTAWQLKLEEV